MATPTVESVTVTPFATDANNHLVAMPATVNAGDLLLMMYAGDDSIAAATLTTPTDWSALSGPTDSPSSAQFVVYGKDAVGDEDGTTVDVVCSTTQKGVAHVWRISGWGGTLADDVDVGTAATGTSTTPNPPSVTAGWGSDTNLFISCFGGNNDNTVSAFPTSYTGNNNSNNSTGGTGGATVASCSRALTAASDDPSTFTWSESTGWVAQTIVVKPAAAATTKSYKLPLFGVS